MFSLIIRVKVRLGKEKKKQPKFEILKKHEVGKVNEGDQFQFEIFLKHS